MFFICRCALFFFFFFFSASNPPLFRGGAAEVKERFGDGIS